jgi:hypothetical protein
MRGTRGADRLTGGWQSDGICAPAGNGTCSSAAPGNDRRDGGSGDDRVRGGAATTR